MSLSLIGCGAPDPTDVEQMRVAQPAPGTVKHAWAPTDHTPYLDPNDPVLQPATPEQLRGVHHRDEMSSAIERALGDLPSPPKELSDKQYEKLIRLRAKIGDVRSSRPQLFAHALMVVNADWDEFVGLAGDHRIATLTLADAEALSKIIDDAIAAEGPGRDTARFVRYDKERVLG